MFGGIFHLKIRNKPNSISNTLKKKTQLGNTEKIE
jgi:hypothetical protein